MKIMVLSGVIRREEKTMKSKPLPTVLATFPDDELRDQFSNTLKDYLKKNKVPLTDTDIGVVGPINTKDSYYFVVSATHKDRAPKLFDIFWDVDNQLFKTLAITQTA